MRSWKLIGLVLFVLVLLWFLVGAGGAGGARLAVGTGS
jgi:hypothetical protein